jgi:hypothetical protein
MYSKYGKFVDRIPGLSKSSLDYAYKNMKQNISNGATNNQIRRNSPEINLSKYPKLK